MLANTSSLGDVVPDIGLTGGDAPDRCEDLIGWSVFADISDCARLKRPSDVHQIVVHAEDKNTHAGIGGFQTRDHLEPPDPGQIEIENDQIRALLPERR